MPCPSHASPGGNSPIDAPPLIQYASPRSMESVKGGTRLMASSFPEERTLVRFFPLVGFTVISSPLAVLPMTWPSYTSAAGPIGRAGWTGACESTWLRKF